MTEKGKKENAEEICNRFVNDEETDADRNLLLSWLHAYRASERVDLQGEELNEAFEISRSKIMTDIKKVNRYRVKRLWMAAAAAVLIVLSFFYLYIGQDGDFNDRSLTLVEELDQAVLNLENGKSIALNKLDTGLVTENELYSVYLDNDGFLEYRYKEGEAEVESVISWHEIKTPTKEQLKVKLVDGTEVWLNASSTLRYPSRFEKDRREVHLEGEAYFKVVRDAGEFIVETDPQIVQVLGTEFNVEAYKSSSVAKTSLITGKVNVRGTKNKDSAISLDPGYQFITKENGGSTVQKIKSIEHTSGWRNGDIYILDESLYEALKKIERAYGVKIDVGNRKLERRVSGVFSKNQSLETVLKTLEKISELKFNVKGESVLIENN